MLKICKVILVISVLGSLVVCGDAAVANVVSSQVHVSLTIEKWVSVKIHNDIVMTTVTSAWFGHELQSSGSTLVDVYTNTDATLRCLQTTHLHNGDSYTVDVGMSMLGPNPTYLSGNYWCIDFSPGGYPSSTVLTSTLKKIWTVNDVADTYTGTVTLELVSNP